VTLDLDAPMRSAREVLRLSQTALAAARGVRQPTQSASEAAGAEISLRVLREAVEAAGGELEIRVRRRLVTPLKPNRPRVSGGG
jgi:hypothetical protein